MSKEWTGDRIRAGRRAHGLTATELAIKIGVTRSAVSQWETGRAVPSFPHLYALDHLFGPAAEQDAA